MKRVYLHKEDINKIFKVLRTNLNLNNQDLAFKLSISPRTLNDWINARYGIPLHTIEYLVKRYQIEMPKGILIKDEKDVRAIAGKIGGATAYQKYGNPGTYEGRKKGGFESLKTHNAKHTGFVLRKVFIPIQPSEKLAEFIGVMLGDGGMTKYQVRISLNKKDDALYAEYLQDVIIDLFRCKPTVRDKKNVRELVISGIDFVEKLNGLGLVVGNKIKQSISVPNWILKNSQYCKMCIRGLFDTDGSVFLDVHTIRGKRYSSSNVAITTYSPKLFGDINRIFRNMGFNPTISTKHRVTLRQREQVVRFFRIIRPSNAKHLIRFQKQQEV